MQFTGYMLHPRKAHHSVAWGLSQSLQPSHPLQNVSISPGGHPVPMSSDSPLPPSPTRHLLPARPAAFHTHSARSTGHVVFCARPPPLTRSQASSTEQQCRHLAPRAAGPLPCFPSVARTYATAMPCRGSAKGAARVARVSLLAPSPVPT